MNKQEYEVLEEILNENNNLIVKYQLGIVYSCQREKRAMSINIYKELIEEDYQNPSIYLFLSKHTYDYKERNNLLKCGLQLFPENAKLNFALAGIKNCGKNKLFNQQVKFTTT